MTSSATANAALLQSLQRARERQSRASSVKPSSAMDTASLSSNPDRRPVKLDERPPWNGSSVARPTKTPRSVFLDTPSALENGQAGRRTPSPRPKRENEAVSSVKVVPMPVTVVEQPPALSTVNGAGNMPVYVQPYPQTMYPQNAKVIRTEPEVIIMESETRKSSCWDCFGGKNDYRKRYYADREGLLNQRESPVYRGCECCARGRLASSCPSCYFCELFYGCPLYCWILAFLLLLLPMLALFGWFLSEQPALNPAKRQYVTQQSSIVQNEVYAVMRNCAVPYCTNPSPATTINQLYLTYRDYSVTQVTSSGYRLSMKLSILCMVALKMMIEITFQMI